MPGFPSTVSAQPEIVASVGLKTDERGDQGVRYLADEQDNAGQSRVETEDQVKKDQQVGEPHGSADVIQDMTRAIG